VFELRNNTYRKIDIFGLVFQSPDRHRRSAEEIDRHGLRQPAIELLEEFFDRLATFEYPSYYTVLLFERHKF